MHVKFDNVLDLFQFTYQQVPAEMTKAVNPSIIADFWISGTMLVATSDAAQLWLFLNPPEGQKVYA